MVGQHHQLSEHEFEETPEDSGGRGAWCAVVHGVTKTWAQFSDQTKKKKKQIHKVMYVGEKIQNTKSQRASFHGVGKIDPDNSKIGQLFNVCGRSKLCKK